MSALVLRKAENDDLSLLVGWLNDPNICRYLTENLRGGALTERLLAAGLRRRDQAWYLFSESADGLPLGLVALDAIEPQDSHANLWFVLGAKNRAGEGLTSAAIRLFCDKNPEGLHSVAAWAIDANEASVRCLKRAGFDLVGRLNEAARLDDGWHDRVLLQKTLSGGA